MDYIRYLRQFVGHEKVIINFAGGCLLNDQGQVLLQRRGDSGLWGFPGGALEIGEDPQQAAVRELREETGLEVTVGALIGVYTARHMVYPNGDQTQSILMAFHLKQTGGQLRCDGDETIELRWFSITDEQPELFCDQHRALWQDLKNGCLGVVRTV